MGQGRVFSSCIGYGLMALTWIRLDFLPSQRATFQDGPVAWERLVEVFSQEERHSETPRLPGKLPFLPEASRKEQSVSS